LGLENWVGGGGRHRGKKFNFFNQIISLENLFVAWQEFKKGKIKKKDVLEFMLQLEDNIFYLAADLQSGNYQHDHYNSFFVSDPKLRHIHKACVRDRLLHHAIVRVIEPVFERIFIFDSYSSRFGKGTHKAIIRFKKFAWRLSQNNTKTVWILKCDIKKYFDSIDHEILLSLIKKQLADQKLLNLLENIISSYHQEIGKGIPLGNLTSQLFANIYLNHLDYFIKRNLSLKFYVRYADDFLVLGRSQTELAAILCKLDEFLAHELKLSLHPQKVSIQKWQQGLDFLGYKIFPQHIILRTKTKKRMFKLVEQKNFASYNGILKHCRGHELQAKLVDKIFGPH